jgi:hypothetical protein
MRKTYRLAAALSAVILSVGVLIAAQDAKDRGEIELDRMQVQTKRQQVIKDHMQFTPQESELFWSIYRNYHNSLAKIEDRQIEIMDGFSKNYKGLTDQQASKMLKELLQLKMDKLDVDRVYLARFENAMPPRKVARYFQLESKMDAVANYGLVGKVPLAE